MAVVGLRCWKDALSYVVLDRTSEEPLVLDHRYTRMPKADRADQLVWLRQEVIEILDRTTPAAVSFKAAETVARAKDDPDPVVLDTSGRCFL